MKLTAIDFGMAEKDIEQKEEYREYIKNIRCCNGFFKRQPYTRKDK